MVSIELDNNLNNKLELNPLVSTYASALAYQLVTTNTKLNGLIKQDSQNANLISLASNVFISVLGVKYTLQGAVLGVASAFGNSVMANKPVNAITYISYETTTKAGQFNDWTIGGRWCDFFTSTKRKYYRHDYAVYTDSNGYQRQRTLDRVPPAYSPVKTVTQNKFNDAAGIKSSATLAFNRGVAMTDSPSL